jgi:hypothetical protein
MDGPSWAQINTQELTQQPQQLPPVAPLMTPGQLHRTQDTRWGTTTAKHRWSMNRGGVASTLAEPPCATSQLDLPEDIEPYVLERVCVPAVDAEWFGGKPYIQMLNQRNNVIADLTPTAALNLAMHLIHAPTARRTTAAPDTPPQSAVGARVRPGQYGRGYAGPGGLTPPPGPGCRGRRRGTAATPFLRGVLAYPSRTVTVVTS